MLDKIATDPFSKILLQINDLSTVENDTWHGFSLERNLRSKSLHLAQTEEVAIPHLEPDFLKLCLGEEPLEQIDPPDYASDLDVVSEGRRPEEADAYAEGDDIWDDAVISRTTAHSGLLAWDRFEGHNEDTPVQQYLTEAGTEVYGVIWDQFWAAEHSHHLKFARTDRFHKALTSLIVGRSSSFFKWNQEAATFELTVKDFCLVDHSPGFTQILCNRLCECGTLFRTIRGCCDSFKKSNSTLFALQSSSMQVLHAIETHSFGQQAVPPTPTILQLVESAGQYVELLRLLQNLVDIAATIEDETDFLTKSTWLLDNVWFSSDSLRPVLSNIATQILTPALCITLDQLDLCAKQSERQPCSHWTLSKLMPSYHDAFTETVECLTTIREHISSTAPNISRNLPVRVIHRWYELDDLQHEAEKLEHDLRSRLGGAKAIVGGAPTAVSALNVDLNPPMADPFKLDFPLSMKQSSSLLIPSTRDSIQDAVSTFLHHGHIDEVPELSPVQALEMSLSPFLAVQHRISSYTLMRILFLQDNVVAHLDLLHSFQLLGNGSFAARLSRALFDADENSAEDPRKMGLTAGLRLEDREVWPPASSELRLALMGLLAESSSHKTERDVLGCMSFAIRDLSDRELELCRDVHSTHALDFLRLVYAPSNAILELVITSSVLDKYDQIYKFLLVLLRMHALSQSLVAKIVCHQPMTRPFVAYHRFCLEFHLLVNNLVDFVLHEAIELPWSHFMKHVRAMNSCLKASRYDESMRLAGSIAQLRKMHEDCLDEMLRTLLLKKEQATVYDRLRRILTLGLKFTSHSTMETSSTKTIQLYKEFKRSLRALLAQMKKMSKTSQDPALQRLDLLLLKLDMFSYYDDSTA